MFLIDKKLCREIQKINKFPYLYIYGESFAVLKKTIKSKFMLTQLHVIFFFFDINTFNCINM